MKREPIRLVAFDMEGCLTDDPTVWEIMHRRLGTWDSHGAPYWERYRAGEFGYDEFARMDVAVWRGAPASLLHEAAGQVRLMPGCAEVLGALGADGVTVAVVTNGLLCVAERFRQEFGVARLHGNRALARDGALSGEIEIGVPYGAKGEVLGALVAELGLRPSQVAAVGDSVSDVAMFEQAGVGVAFGGAEDGVAEAATHVVREKNLLPVLEILRGDR